ncbi:MAG: tripartite ATP-independent transporter DctP family solute receptor [Verrucomicrobiales bacterium]|jgi:tripartite ATP-independent transporter DctP family solute receptor
MRLLSSLLLTVLLLTSCTSCRSDRDDVITFRYSNSQPAGAIRSQSMQFFKQELEKRSNGRIQVELYFGGVLGTERELMDFVATGALQGTRGGFFADANPKYNLLMMPFLVDDWDQAIRLMNSDLVAEINVGAQARGYHVPACGISQGFRAHTNNVHPIKTPKDLEGMKMRVPQQEVYVKTAFAFGENPQEIPATGIYQAIQTGVVDGQDNPPANIWDYKIYEVCKFMTVTNYATGPDPFIVDLAWYSKLPPDLQGMFDEVAREAMALSDRMNRESEQDFINKLETELEINHVTGEALAPFRDKVGPVYDHFLRKGDFSQQDIDRARNVAKEDSA